MLTQMVIALSALVANGAADGIVARHGIHADAPDQSANADPARSAEEAVRNAVKQFEEMERSFTKQRIKERQELEEKRQRLRWLRREHEPKLQREFAEIQKTEEQIQEIKNTFVPGEKGDKAAAKAIAACRERKDRLQAETDERAKQIITAVKEVVVLEENLRLLERQQEFSRQRARAHLEVLEKRTKHVP